MCGCVCKGEYWVEALLPNFNWRKRELEREKIGFRKITRDLEPKRYREEEPETLMGRRKDILLININEILTF